MHRGFKIAIVVSVLIVITGLTIIFLSISKNYTNSPLKAFKRVNDSLEVLNKKYNSPFDYNLSDSAAKKLELYNPKVLEQYNSLVKKVDSIRSSIRLLKINLIESAENKDSVFNSSEHMIDNGNAIILKEK